MFEITLDVAPKSGLVQKPRQRIKSQSVSLTKVFSGSEDSLVTVTCTMSVTISKVRPVKNLSGGSDDSGTILPILIVTDDNESLVKSRKRVADHGEVFTSSWMVEDMLNLVKLETERIDSRFLEPACGSGNFLKVVLTKKLETVQSKYGKSEFERKHQALFALMCIYGIELLSDNIEECRQILLEVFATYLKIGEEDTWYQAARAVLKANILQGDALTLTTSDGEHIEFPEWGYLGGGLYQRRDFRYDALTQRSSIQGTLFEMFEEHQLFVPTKIFPKMSAQELAK